MGEQTNENDALRARLEDAIEAWGWHDETEDRKAGYGIHMSQMLYRLPRDRQTDDMRQSIEQMLADLDTALYRVGLAEEAGHVFPCVQRCQTCIHPEGYDRLSGPCPTCGGDGVIPPGGESRG